MFKFALGVAATIVLIEVAHRRGVKLPFGCTGDCAGKTSVIDAKPSPTIKVEQANPGAVGTRPNYGESTEAASSVEWDKN